MTNITKISEVKKGARVELRNGFLATVMDNLIYGANSQKNLAALKLAVEMAA